MFSKIFALFALMGAMWADRVSDVLGALTYNVRVGFRAMFAVPCVNYVPDSASSVDTQNATALRRIAYEKKMRADSIRPSIWTQLKSAIQIGSDKVAKVMKSGIWLEVTVKPDGGQSCVIAMRKPLRKAPQYGTDNHPLGNEDEQDLLWTRLYYNEIKKGIKYKGWGYLYNDTKYLKFIESYGPAVSEYMAELRDLHIQQALLTTIDEGLTNSPVSRSPQFNKNWVIPNATEGDYPSWDTTSLTVTNGSADTDNYYSSRTYSGSTTFAENIAAACLAGSGTGATSKALCTVDFMAQLSDYVTSTLALEPVMIDGMPTYMFVIPSRVWHWTVNPNNSGSLGEHFQAVSEYKDPKRATLIGEIGRVYEHFVLIKNLRNPTVTIGGSAGSYTIRPNYVLPGNNDDRNSSDWSNTSGSTNYAFDIAQIVGANALAEYLVDPMVTGLTETNNYGQDQGRAAYLGAGIQIPRFDKDQAGQLDGASATAVQKGSAIVPFSRAPIATIS